MAMLRRAFTLMEMLIVLAIISLIFAGSYMGFSAVNDEQALQKPYIDLRSLAKTAWQRALHEQNSWQIRFYADRFELQPKLAVNLDDQKMFREADKAMGRASGVESVKVREGIMMEVKRWGARNWMQTSDKAPVDWVFEHSGLCEPISVRFTSDHGTIGAQFDPLTASVEEEIFDRDGQ